MTTIIAFSAVNTVLNFRGDSTATTVTIELWDDKNNKMSIPVPAGQFMSMVERLHAAGCIKVEKK